MNISQNLKPHEFREWIAEASDGFRRKIELEVEAFPTDEEARLERLKKIADPATGYRFFCETYFPHYQDQPNSMLHDDLFHLLPDMILDEKGRRELLTAPRGSAKSTHGALFLICYAIVRKLKHYPCIVMDTFEQAALSIEALKAELEINPRLAQDFPDIVGKGRIWREGNIITRNNVRVEGFGSGKAIRGRRHGPYRPDLVILDDIENDENIANPKQRDKLANWIDKAILKLGPPDGSMDVLFIGTVIHFDAVIVRYSKKPGWGVRRYQAVMRWPDNMELWDEWEETFQNDGEPAADRFYEANKAALDKGAVLNWPGNHTLLFLMKERASGHGAFESEYQNNPINTDNAFQHITWWVARRREVLTFGAIDPSLGKRNKNGDPSAILVGSIDREGEHLDVLTASIRRRAPSVIIDDAIALQKEHGCTLWFVETVQYQEMLRTELQKKAAKKGVAMPCYPVIPILDKALRIERLQTPIMDGMIRLHRSQKTLIDQLQQWPLADHDDGPDCLEMLWTYALEKGIGALQPDSIVTDGRQSAHDTMGGFRL